MFGLFLGADIEDAYIYNTPAGPGRVAMDCEVYLCCHSVSVVCVPDGTSTIEGFNTILDT